MSHVASVDLKITNLDALETACAALGLELVRNKKTYNWYGQWLDDWSDAERAAALKGHDPAQFGKCEHAIRVKGAGAGAYEIGLVPRLDGGKGYEAIYDSWGGGGAAIEAKAGVGLSDLKKTLAEEVVKRHYAAKGYQTSVTVNANGERQIIGVKHT